MYYVYKMIQVFKAYIKLLMILTAVNTLLKRSSTLPKQEKSKMLPAQ